MSSSTNELFTNVAVIIRSVGERTEALCAHLVKQQVPESHVTIIHERPFSQAVRRSYEIGLDFGLDWTLCVDADVLLREGAIPQLVDWASGLPENVFKFAGTMVDKLLGDIRIVGAHLYRTRLCGIALGFIEESDAQIRPETYVNTRMADSGFPHKANEQLQLAVHDYEQYYSDIYRKAITHTQKFAGRMAYAVEMWQRLMTHDTDFRVALWGHRISKVFDGALRIDREIFPEEIDSLLKLSGMQEKPALTKHNWNTHLPDEIMGDYIPPEEYVRWSHMCSLRNRKLGGLRIAINRFGVRDALPWLMGKNIQTLGSLLQHWIEKRYS